MNTPFSQSRWIGVPDVVEDAHFAFRRCVSLDHKPATSPIRITADARYMLWVNGEFVGRGPARGYPFAQPYDEFDIAPFLREGENWIAAQVYQFGPGVGAFGMSDKGSGVYVSTGKTGLIIEGELVCTDGTWQVRRADWHLPELAPYMYGCFGFQEFKDARREPAGWQIGKDPTLSPGRLDTAPTGLDAPSKTTQGGAGACPGLLTDAPSGHEEATSVCWRNAVEITAPGGAPWTGFEPRGLKPMRETLVCPLPLVAAFTGANGLSVNDPKSLKTLWQEENLDPVLPCPEGATSTSPGQAPAPPWVIPNQATSPEGAASRLPRADADGWVEVTPPVHGFVALVFDLGWFPAVYPRIEVRHARGGEILDSGYGGHLGKDGRPMVWAGACDRFIAASGESARQCFLPRGCRYHTIKVRSDHPVSLRVSAVVTHHDVAGPLPFACSDEGLTKAWQVTERTLRTSMLDAFVDNSWREQTQWSHDGFVGAIGAWATYGDTSLWRRLLWQTAQSAACFDDGAVHAMVACDPVYQRSVMPIFDHSLHWIPSIERYLTVSGDAGLLADIMPALRRFVMDHVESGFTSENLVIQPLGSKIFLDWTPRPFDKRPYNLTLNLSVLLALESAGRLADAASDAGLAEYCKRRGNDLREAVAARFWSAEHHGWRENIEPSEKVRRELIETWPANWLEDPWQPLTLQLAVNKEPTPCTRHANALAAALRVGSPEQQAAAAKLVVAAFEPDHVCNNGMSFLWNDKIFGSLFESGQADAAIRLLQENQGAWALQGGLHWTETWGIGNVAQLCGSSLNWLLSGYILGIRPTATGFSEAIFDPRPGSLSWAKGMVPTPHGNIHVQWKRGDDGVIEAGVAAPEGVTVRAAIGLRVTITSTNSPPPVS
jgi:hypothetical protein